MAQVREDAMITRRLATASSASTNDALTLATGREKLLVVITEEIAFRLHRLEMGRAALDAGIEVVVVTRSPDNGTWLEKQGYRFIPIPLYRKGRNPLRECLSIVRLVQIYRHEKPSIVHHFHMKPVLYGSWAARFAHVPAVVNTFCGLGYVFTSDDWRCRLLRGALTVGLRSALALPNSRALFENHADRERLIRAKIVKSEQTTVVSGAGVDITKFTPMPEQSGTPLIVLASRMIWDKGVGDFVEAARLLREQKIPGRFVLVGSPDPDNPSSISESQLKAWQEEGVIEWWGWRQDMLAILTAAHIFVLPTFYGEGIPRILLEACACARAVVTTTNPGCTDLVHDGSNGLLVPPKDPRSLARAIRTLLEDPATRMRMGRNGRERVVNAFSTDRVISQTFHVYEELLRNSSQSGGCGNWMRRTASSSSSWPI